MGSEPPSVMKVMKARKMPIVPSVTMKGSIRPTVTISPLKRPHSAPTSSATPAPIGIAQAPKAGARWFIAMIMIPVTKAIIEPTDRSSPPDEITKVAPTAIIAMKALRVMTLIRLADDTKLGFTSAPNSTITARAMKGARSAQRMRAPSLVGASVAVATVMFLLPDVRAPTGRGGVDDIFLIDFIAA